MTLKTKLISSISAFVLILTIVIVGVWAATQANIPMGGSVNFAATDVYVKITGEVEGAENSSAYTDLPVLNYSGTTQPSEADLQRWQELDVNFNSSAKPIKVKITIENLSTERWLLVNVIEGENNGSPSNNLNREVQKENGAYTLGENHTLNPSTGEGTSKVEFTINLTVDDPNYSVNTVYDYIINLNNSNEEPPEPTKELDFTFSGNKVTGYTGNETNITIPTSYSMERTPYNSFVFTAEEFEQRTPEARNKMAMLYALKNYTVYILDGQSEGFFCENGFKDFMSLMGNSIDPAIFPLRVELPEDLTFELTEAELEGGQGTEETEFKLAALELLQNFYVQFGENSEEILCRNYDDFATKLNEIMPEGPKPEDFPLKFRIDYASYKFFEGDDYQVEVIGNFSLTPSTSEPIVLTIPSEISIDMLAFFEVTHEFSIVFEDGQTEIGMGAFYGCINLTSVSLPSTLTSIGDFAFRECTSLTSIIIPEGVTEIGSQAFNGCSSLTSITIPKGVTSIREYAFQGSGLTTISIPEGVTEIDRNAFRSCSNLTSVSLPSTLTSISTEAFRYCYALAIVYNNSSLEITAGSFGNGYVGGYAVEIVTSGNNPAGRIETEGDVQYYVNEQTRENIALAPSAPRESLTSITIREGTTEINQYAFEICRSLTSVSLPSTLTSIANDAFRDCSSLTTITILEGVTSIGEYAFWHCYALAIVYNNSSLEITASSSDNGAVGYYAEEIVTNENPQVGEIVVEGNVQYYVNEQTEENIALAPSVPRVSLTSVTIKEGTTEINQYAFWYCISLTSITIPEGVTSIGWSAFRYCSSLTSVSLPSTLTSIGEYAFGNCISLTSITIPEGVPSIGDFAFSYCSSLISVSLPSTLASIGGNAFYDCSSLIEITINGNISSLGSYAFYYCDWLTSLTLGEGVSTLPNNLFTDNNLTRLTEIVVLGDLRSETFPRGTWEKDGEVVTSFSGAGTYTRTDV